MENKRPLSVTNGRVYIDGVMVADCCKYSAVFTPKVWEGKALGDPGTNRRWIGYDITGLVETVEVRAMDPGTGKVIASKKKLSNNLSTGSLAKGLVSGSTKVYIDPTVTTQEQADARASYLAEDVSYRLGSLECVCPGLPDLAPGRFVKVTGLGVPVDNTFYVTSVVHDFRQDSGYQTRLTGKAAEVQK